MKTFKQIIAEVAEPKSGDEQNFKQKHYVDVIDHPAAVETQFSSKKLSKKRKADYMGAEDDIVYEAKMDPVGKEDDDIDNDGDKDSSDEYLHARRKAIAKAMKEAAEKKLDPVGKADADIDNDGDTDSSDEYLHARRKAIAKAMKKEAAQSPYAVGMAAAMKATGDKPPLKKSTIMKAHKIAKAVEKNESAELDEADDKEAEKRNKNFWKFTGMTNKEILDSKAKAEKKTKKESVQIDEANASKIIAGLNAGDSIDVIVQNNLNKKGDNRDEILKVIRDYNWKKRMKKESANKIDEATPTKKEITRALQSIKAQPKEKVTLKKAPWSEKNEEVGLAEAALTPQQRDRLDHLIDMAATTSHPEYDGNENTSKYINLIKKEFGDTIAKQVDDGLEKMHWGRDNQSSGNDKLAARARKGAPRITSSGKMNKQDVSALKNRIMSDKKLWGGIAKSVKLPEQVEQIDESFKAGSVKLNDGSSVIIKEQDAKLLNKLVNELNDKNKDAMMKTAMKDKKGFNEILSFAREAL